MTTAISSTLSAPSIVPPSAAEAPTPAANATQQSPAIAANVPPGAPPLTEGTLGALVAQQDVAAGSQATSASTTTPLNLKGQDLRQTDLKTLNLKGADLSGANLSGLDLSGLDFSGANLNGADLSGATLTNTKLNNITAQGANLSQATVVNATLNGADFTNANFNGAYVGNAAANTLDSPDYNQHVAENISNLTLDGASFEGATIQRINFNKSSAVGANFSNLTANTVSFKDSNLQGANFDHFAGGVGLGFINSDLSNAALTNMGSSKGGNLFSGVNLSAAKFAGSSFNNTGIAVTALSQANLTGMVREANHAIFNTDLSGVDLSGFSFSQTVFDGSSAVLGNAQGAPLANASSVRGANFSGASFSAVMFSNMDLGGANFSGASFSQVYAQNDKSGTLTGVAGVQTGDRVSTSTAVAIFGSYIAGNAPADGMQELGFNSGPTSASQNTTGLEGPSQVQTPSTAPTSKDQAAALALKTLTAINDQLSAARKSLVGTAQATNANTRLRSAFDLTIGSKDGSYKEGSIVSDAA